MKIKEFDIRLDIKKKHEQEQFEVVQGDSKSNLIRISLTDGLEPYDLSGTMVEIVFSKADGKTVQQTSETGISIINEAQGRFQCILKTNSIACPGPVEAEVRILDGEVLLTTVKFKFHVRKSLINDDTIESSDEFPILTQLISTTEGLIEQVEQIEKQVPENVLTELGNKIDKTSIVQTDTISDATKVPSSVVTEALGKEIDTLSTDLSALSNNLANLGESDKKLKFVACTIRKQAAGWEALSTDGHAPINVLSVSADASKITLIYNFTAKNILSFVACPDDTFAQNGVFVGSSVGIGASTIFMSQNKQIGGYIYYDGANWNIQNCTGISSAVFSSGVLTITHNNLTGYLVSVAGRGGKYNVQAGSIGDTSAQVMFYDKTGELASAPDANMRFYFTKSSPATLINPQTVNMPNSNIWILGLFEV